MRKWGQEIISTLGGRRIHPVFAVPGGVNKALLPAEREAILKDIDAQIATTKIGLQIIKDWAAANKEDIDKFGVFPTGYFGLVTPKNGLELFDGKIRLIDSAGKQLEMFEGKNYLDHIAEHVENWSYLKFPYYKKLGYPGGVYRVGPLGRLNASDVIETPMANEELKLWKQINNGKPVENTLLYHYARLIETLFAIERVRILLDDPDIFSTDIMNNKTNFQGVGCWCD